MSSIQIYEQLKQSIVQKLSLVKNECNRTIKPPDLNNWANVCRICLCSVKTILDKIKIDENISERIKEFGKVSIIELDNLPMIICKECEQFLEAIGVFQELCQTSDKLLSSALYKRENTESNIRSIENYVPVPLAGYSAEDHGVSDGVLEDNSYAIEVKVEYIPELALSGDDPDSDELNKDLESKLNEETAVENVELNQNDSLEIRCSRCKVFFDSMYNMQKHYETEHRKYNIRNSRNTSGKSEENSNRRKMGNIRIQPKRTVNKNALIENDQRNKNNTAKGVRRKPKKNSTEIDIDKNVIGDDTTGYKCKVCGKVFDAKKKYLVHTKVHLKLFVCEKCGARFSSSGNLESHTIRIHENVFPFECKECPYRARCKWDLSIHKRVHTGEKPYICAECPRTFANRSNLNHHTRSSHTNVSFQCELCNKSFKSMTRVREHKKTMHAIGERQTCPMCASSFATKKILRKHMIRTHNVEKRREDRKGLCFKVEQYKLGNTLNETAGVAIEPN